MVWCGATDSVQLVWNVDLRAVRKRLQKLDDIRELSDGRLEVAGLALVEARTGS
jgi:hypothetical protein